jgi:hypothetical protein
MYVRPPAPDTTPTIATQGRWSPASATLYRYMQIVDQWEDNTVRGIGL